MSRLLKLLYPIVYLLSLPASLWRLGKTRGLGTLPARCGFLPEAAFSDSIWLHGSSVGEVTLLGPLIEQIEKVHADTPIVISAFTQTGLATARVRYPRHYVFPFPFDFAFAVRRCLRALRPKLVVIAESEFWPRFLTSLTEHDVPFVIVNAKMSDKSFRVHERTGFVAQSLRHAAAIGAQSVEHETRLRALGVERERIEVTGNMKYDLIVSAAAHDETGRDRLGFAADEVVIIGGSLHEGEDELLLDAVASLADRTPRVRLIIVPRYPEQAARVMTNLVARGLEGVCKSELDGVRKLTSSAVLVVDTVGELRDLYRIADIAFVGGSMFYRGSNKGGHNLMEPAICGMPVIFGPYNFSFRDTAADLVAGEAGIEVETGAALAEALSRLVEEPARRRDMGERARRLVLASRGASARNFALLERALAGRRH